MKKVVLLSATAVLVLPFVSCKETPKDPEKEIIENTEEVPKEDLALASEEDLNKYENGTFLYVTALNGLSLREYDNLQSKKLGKMPYGTKVKLLKPEGKNTMTVSGIPGAMDEIEFNHKKGYAFNGYLSKYFPPERDITVQGYVEELQRQFPEIQISETVEGPVSKPVNNISITLPNAAWHEAYFIAQNLFDFPKEFDFPNPKGKDLEIIEDSKPKKGIWTSQLEINRVDHALERIAYVYSSQKLLSTVTIEKAGNNMVISRKEAMK